MDGTFELLAFSGAFWIFLFDCVWGRFSPVGAIILNKKVWNANWIVQWSYYIVKQRSLIEIKNRHFPTIMPAHTTTCMIRFIWLTIGFKIVGALTIYNLHDKISSNNIKLVCLMAVKL